MAGKTFRIEKDVKKEVKRLLDQHKWFWWVTPTGGFGASGISDILAFRGGVFMALETKFGFGKTTALQKGFLSSIAAEQGFSMVVNEKNIGWFAVFLQAFDAAVAAQPEQPKPEDGAAMLNAIKALTEGY